MGKDVFEKKQLDSMGKDVFEKKQLDSMGKDVHACARSFMSILQNERLHCSKNK